MSEERISRSAVFALSSQLTGAVMTAVLTVFLGRQLSPDQYGRFAFAMTVIVLATPFADAGITISSGRSWLNAAATLPPPRRSCARASA